MSRTIFELSGPSVKSVTDRGPNDLSVFALSQSDQGIFKALIPEFLYKPPFGFPRGVDIPLLRSLAKNGYVFSVVQTITDLVSQHDWEICTKEGFEVSDEDKEKVRNFFNNPNSNRESFKQILKMVTTDILELDAGVIVKVFNLKQDLVEIYSRDGGTFLKNTDIYGTIRDKAEIIFPDPRRTERLSPTCDNVNEVAAFGSSIESACQAAWFQFGWTHGSVPIPFGQREIVYFMRNPRSDEVYGRAALQVLGEILFVLIYGSAFYLDFYLNNNMPEGVITLEGADKAEMKAFADRFSTRFRRKDNFGNDRKQFFKYPIHDGKAEFVHFTVSPEEMGVIEQQKWFIKIFWSCFGITPSEMGETENSNNATEIGQNVVVKRKVVKPLLELLEYKINTEIIPEFEIDGIEFKFKQFDIEEELKKADLFQKQISMGIKTPEMIAEEEGIDVEKLKKQKDEAFERKKELLPTPFDNNSNPPKQSKPGFDGQLNKKDADLKAKTSEDVNDIENHIQDIGRQLVDAVDRVSKSPINSI